MDEIDKILLKMHYKARKEAIGELLKENKNNPKIVKKLKRLQETEPTIA
jgi:hypothetical protein